MAFIAGGKQSQKVQVGGLLPEIRQIADLLIDGRIAGVQRSPLSQERLEERTLCDSMAIRSLALGQEYS